MLLTPHLLNNVNSLSQSLAYSSCLGQQVSLNMNTNDRLNSMISVSSIPPAITIQSGGTVSFSCLIDASNGQITKDSTVSAITSLI